MTKFPDLDGVLSGVGIKLGCHHKKLTLKTDGCKVGSRLMWIGRWIVGAL